MNNLKERIAEIIYENLLSINIRKEDIDKSAAEIMDEVSKIKIELCKELSGQQLTRFLAKWKTLGLGEK